MPRCSRRSWRRANESVYLRLGRIYTDSVSKRLVDIDEKLLAAARAELGTDTIKATVNEALRRAAKERRREVRQALDRLAEVAFIDRREAWR